MSAKNRSRLKKIWRGFLKGVLTKTAYCIYVDKLHKMEYRSTVVNKLSFNQKKRVHINMCDNCKLVTFVDA